MDYLVWREEIFGQPEGSDPVCLELPQDLYALSPEQNLDFIDQALNDKEIHEVYTREQIGIGLQLLFNNACGNIVFSYLDAEGEPRRVAAFRSLIFLYRNYFQRYCIEPVAKIGEHCAEGVSYMCYMFWDIFVAYPQNTPPSVVCAGIEVMSEALAMDNEQCQVSAIHGLGHWVMYRPEVRDVLSKFIDSNKGRANPVSIEYARQALTGCIQ
jgi:hypothetical protein